MARGKSICSVLKTIRKQVADANGIVYEPRECHHQGDCRGTCPACEAEVRYIQQQLDIRRQLGKAVAVGKTKELAPSEILSADYTDYLLEGSLTLKNGRIDKYQFDEGYCQAEKYIYNTSQDEFTFCYYDKDHLGNVHQVTEADGTKTGYVIQKINYYPFGAQFCDGSTDSNVQSHKYNGKEFDKMHGLNTYDYGARQYNPITARWDRIDPLAEKYYSVSPYAYCGNNPMKFVDPDGKELGLPEEILFGLSHPLITSRIGIGVTKGAVNINTNATRFATRGEILYGSIPNEQEERGSENGAFRHTLWQAQITSEYGSDIAKQVGDAHEDNPYIDMGQTFFANINDADKSVDLHNNIIGRAIGENNKGAKMDKNAISVLKVYMKEGLYQAKKIKGGYKVERVKLNSSKGKKLMNILNQLDENGRYPSERPKPGNDRIRRYEALQNSLH